MIKENRFILLGLAVNSKLKFEADEKKLQNNHMIMLQSCL